MNEHEDGGHGELAKHKEGTINALATRIWEVTLVRQGTNQRRGLLHLHMSVSVHLWR